MVQENELEQCLSSLYDGQVMDDIAASRILDYLRNNDAKNSLEKYEQISFMLNKLPEYSDESLNFQRFPDISQAVLDKIRGGDFSVCIVQEDGLFNKLKKFIFENFLFEKRKLIPSLYFTRTSVAILVVFMISGGVWSVINSNLKSSYVLGAILNTHDAKLLAVEGMRRDPKLDELLLVNHESNNVHLLQKPVEYLRNSNFSNEP